MADSDYGYEVYASDGVIRWLVGWFGTRSEAESLVAENAECGWHLEIQPFDPNS